MWSSLPRTAPTYSAAAVRWPIAVFFGELVAAFAMAMRADALAADDVLARRDEIEMVYANTAPVPAKVIDY